MQSYYEINVSKDGRHMFATHPRSLQDEERALKCLKLMRKKFPVSEGYNVSMTYWNCKGQTKEGW